ncbi:MAG: hypothetical protein ACE5JV_01115 [Nitrososphaerales archaeon]
MSGWKMEQEEYYFKLYDPKKELAGYFQPDFGKVYPEEKEEEIIQQMLKRQDNIHGGLLYVPMLKLNIASDADYELDKIMENLEDSIERVKRWKECIGGLPSVTSTWARRSHTDPDMLAILMQVKFDGPVRLNKDELLDTLQPLIAKFREEGLL